MEAVSDSRECFNCLVPAQWSKSRLLVRGFTESPRLIAYQGLSITWRGCHFTLNLGSIRTMTTPTLSSINLSYTGVAAGAASCFTAARNLGGCAPRLSSISACRGLVVEQGTSGAAVIDLARWCCAWNLTAYSASSESAVPHKLTCSYSSSSPARIQQVEPSKILAERLKPPISAFVYPAVPAQPRRIC